MEHSSDASDEILRAVVMAAPVAMIVVDGEMTVRLCNPAAERLFGWTLNELVGHPIPFVPADRQDEGAQVLAAVREGRLLPKLETHRLKREGSLVPVALSVAPLGGASGERRALLVFEDLTERQHDDDARARLVSIVESSDDAIVGKTLKGFVTSWNRGAERIFGYTEAEMVGQSIRRIIPPNRADDMDKILAAIGRGERIEHFESERVRKDGQRIDVSLTVSPIRDSTGRIVGASKIARDVTDRKRAETERRRTLRELRTLYAVGQTVAAEQDRKQVLQTITDAATDLSGAQFGAFFYNATDLAGEHYLVYTLSGASLEAFEHFGAPRNTKMFAPTFAGEGVVRSADIQQDPRYAHNPPHGGLPKDRLRVTSYLAVPVTGRAGNVYGGLFLGHAEPGVFSEEAERAVVALAAQAAVALDNATLIEAEQRARAVAEEASIAKDRFLAMLSHELRNPLSSVRNALTTAALDASRSDRALEIARHGTEQLMRLVDDLLDVARITQGRITLRKELVSLGESVEHAIDSVRPLFEERSVALTLSLPPRDLEVNGDAARLEQAVGNLLTNAAKYTGAGGRVTVTLDHVDDRAVLRVRDTGIGLDPTLVPKIFDLFVQGHQALDRTRGGLGIGLTLVKQLIEMHGGSVEALSEGLGHGAEFVIRLPANLRTARSSPKPHQPKAGRWADARVLIVEDNADAGESLTMLLELLGFRVRLAGDGFAALEAARAHVPDVMLVDIGLPGMNGYELAERIRQDETLRRVVLVALTGYGQEEDRQRALAAGFDYHLVKPVDVNKLERFVAGLAASGRTIQ